MGEEHGANHKFINAVRKGDMRELEKLINSYGLPDLPNWSKGYLLLRFAIESKHSEIAKLLLNNGSEVNNENGKPTATPLHFAVKNNDIEIVEMLVNKGAEIDAEDASGLTPLHIAIKEDFSEIAEYLLNCGARVNFSPASYRPMDNTPLHLAIVNGNEHLVELLMSRNANIGVEDENGLTPLHVAVQFSRLEIVERILADESFNFDTMYDSTMNDGKKKSYNALLHLAAQTGDERMIDLLLTRGLDVNAKTDDNSTPLHIATKYKHLTAVEYLLENGADVNAKTEDNKTPLNFAVEIGCPLIVESILKYRPDSNDECNRSALRSAVFKCGSEFERIINCLLNYGFAVKPDDINTDSCLLYSAVNNRHEKVVEVLLKYGADADYSETTTRNKKSLLRIAADKGHESIVRLLIDYGADVNAKDKDDYLPIFGAIQNGHFETVKLLLINGADVKHSFEPLRLAIRNKRAEIVEILLNYSVEMNDIDEHGINALHLAISIEDNEDITKLILNKGIDINARGMNGKTALHIAVENERTAVVDLLLEYNADVDSPSENNATPLHSAALNGSAAIATMLLNKGANINAEQTDGATALHIATTNGHSEVVEILLNRGAKYDFRASKDVKLLHIVAEKNYSHELMTLLKNGADIDLTDDKGETALHIAARNGHEEIVAFLLDYGSDINILNEENNTALDLAIAGKMSIDNQLISKTSHKVDAADYKYIIEHFSIHIIKMKLADLYVSEQNLDEIVVSSVDCLIRRRCEQEIKYMKSKIITNNVSLYDILTKDERQLELYSRNKKIVDALSSNDYQINFPIYSGMLNSRFRKGLKRNDLLEQSSTFFYVLPPSVPLLPRDCIMIILGYLSNKELSFMKIVSSEATDGGCQ